MYCGAVNYKNRHPYLVWPHGHIESNEEYDIRFHKEYVAEFSKRIKEVREILEGNRPIR